MNLDLKFEARESIKKSLKSIAARGGVAEIIEDGECETTDVGSDQELMSSDTDSAWEPLDQLTQIISIEYISLDNINI